MVAASAGRGLVVLSESWANPTSHTLPLVPGTFIPLLFPLLQSADPFVLNGMGFPADWQTLALWK